MFRSDLTVPLLPVADLEFGAVGGARTPGSSSQYSGPPSFKVYALSSGARTPGSSSQYSAPPSFKAGKPRKTKDFIGSAQLTRESWQQAEETIQGDDRHLTTEEVQHIFLKVAMLVFHHLEEGHRNAVCPTDDEFNEKHFLRRRCSHFHCSCFKFLCPRRVQEEPCTSYEVVLKLINDVAKSLDFCKQVIVLCAIYIEKLMAETSTLMTNDNWRSIVVVGLLVASKVWEDIHPWNADFEECLQEVAGIRYTQGALYRLESIFLNKLEWKVFVQPTDYAAYLFSLLEDGNRADRRAPCHLGEEVRRLRERTYSESCLKIDTIVEDEPYNNSDSDLERGLLPGDKDERFSSSAASSPPASPTTACLPWSREELATSWRKRVLEKGLVQGESFAVRKAHEAWRLDANNPLIGALRHAPPAPPPSPYIDQSKKAMWSQKVASHSAQMLGPKAAQTICGATGRQLASEVYKYHHKRAPTDPSEGRDLDSLFK